MGDRTQWLVKRGDTEVRTIDIEASRAVEDNPLFYHNVYTWGDKKIGYLVYNHFTPGPNGYSLSNGLMTTLRTPLLDAVRFMLSSVNTLALPASRL